MAKIINLRILLQVLVVASLAVTPYTIEAAEHPVQWIIPRQNEGPSYYSNLVANITFRLNDILVFNFTTGYHNVVTLSKKDFKDCNVKGKMESFETSPARITLNHTGEFYFACAFPQHCTFGQKLSVNVTGPSSYSPSSPTVAPAEAPSSPAGPGAAMSVAATFSVLLMNVLF